MLREHFITTVPQLRSSESRLDPSQQSVLREHFITMTRSSGSGMRDLPCAGDGNRPGFSCPGFSRPGFSRPGFQHQLLHAFSRPARKNATNWNLLRQSFIAYIFRSQRAREQERARKQEKEREKAWQNPVPFKENYPPPRTCHSLIGCSPSAKLSSRGRQSTWGGELPLAHAQIICLPLRTQDVSAILQRRM